MRNHKEKKRELERMREMLNIDSDSLRKFAFRYLCSNADPISAKRRTKTSTFGRSSSCCASGRARTQR
jgi:hypothetical protein